MDSSYRILKNALEKARVDVKRTEEEKETLDELLGKLEEVKDDNEMALFTIDIEGYIYWLKNKGYWED